MQSYTQSIPKALIPIDEHPFAHHQLAWLSRHGVTDVLYSIGYKGQMIREYVQDGSRWGLRVSYVDEGTQLRGTAGALRFALDQGELADSFFVLYGDSFLPIDFRAVWDQFAASSFPALMTVFRNEGKWDKSNVHFDGGKIQLYDKFAQGEELARMHHIDYGLSAFRRRVIEERVPAGGKHDLADLFHALSRQGSLMGYEVKQRFFEIGSPGGLEDLRHYLKARGDSA